MTLRSIVARQIDHAHRTTPLNFLLVQTWNAIHKATGRLVISRLKWHAQTEQPITDAKSKIYVSLTSFGQRITKVHLAIESIARGTTLPGRIVLWLDDENTLVNLPKPLVALKNRGLEIRLCENLKSFKKFYPALRDGVPEDWMFVTIDDDVIYPRWLLTRLSNFVKTTPKSLVSTVCIAYTMTQDQKHLAPMKSWRWVTENRSNCSHFAIGVGGVVYPPTLRNELIVRETAFLQCTPNADDIWINFVAAELGIGVAQMSKRRYVFPSIPGTQSEALSHTNVDQGQNDIQITATFTELAISNIRSAIEQDI